MLGPFDTSSLQPVEVGLGCRRIDLPGPPGQRVWIAQIDAGATWPFVDSHGPGGEMVLVLEGDLVEGDRSYEAGDSVLYGPYSEHQPSSRHGVLLLGMNILDPEGLPDDLRPWPSPVRVPGPWGHGRGGVGAG